MDAQSELAAKVRRALAAAFDGARICLDPPYGQRLFGQLEWKGFTGVQQLKRQRMVNAALEKSLTGREMSCVAGLLAFTPTEVRMMDREAALSL